MVLLIVALVLGILGETLIYIYGSLQPELPWDLSQEMIDTCFSLMYDPEGCADSEFCLDFYSNGTCYATPLGSVSQRNLTLVESTRIDNHLLLGHELLSREVTILF